MVSIIDIISLSILISGSALLVFCVNINDKEQCSGKGEYIRTELTITTNDTQFKQCRTIICSEGTIPSCHTRTGQLSHKEREAKELCLFNNMAYVNMIEVKDCSFIKCDTGNFTVCDTKPTVNFFN